MARRFDRKTGEMPNATNKPDDASTRRHLLASTATLLTGNVTVSVAGQVDAGLVTMEPRGERTVVTIAAPNGSMSFDLDGSFSGVAVAPAPNRTVLTFIRGSAKSGNDDHPFGRPHLAGGLEPLVKEGEAALALGLTLSTLRADRVRGTLGIPFVKIGSAIRYRPADLRTFVDQRVQSSTPAA